MPTVYEIAQHVILEQPYENNNLQPLKSGVQGATIYQLLTEETTLEIQEKVRDFVSGKLSEKMLDINDVTAYQYLAAAKIVDLDTDSSAMTQSTYKIREMALLCSKSHETRGEINMLNAFSNPSLHRKNADILVALELDRNHPLVKKAPFGEERNNYLSKIYTYCQEEAELIPEMVSIIEEVVKSRFETMLKLAEFFPLETSVIYKGCSGTGKSFALKKFTEDHLPGIDFEAAIQSSDTIKNDIKKRTGDRFNYNQVDLLGFSTFKMLAAVMRKAYPKLSTIQEGWFNSTMNIEGVFKDLQKAEMKLEMHDFDGDYEAICLRILARNANTPPLNQIERCFITTRQSRELLLNSLRETDSYTFHFVNATGEVLDNVDPKTLVINSEEMQSEIEVVNQMIITENHAHIFGNHLMSFVGMTIEAAFKKAWN